MSLTTKFDSAVAMAELGKYMKVYGFHLEQERFWGKVLYLRYIISTLSYDLKTNDQKTLISKGILCLKLVIMLMKLITQSDS